MGALAIAASQLGVSALAANQYVSLWLAWNMR
jgi:hypothetical protein